MTLIGTYTYSPTKEDLKFQDTGWLPQEIDMLDLVEQYDRWVDGGRESDWWGSLHTASHPESCMNCIDVNIYTEDSILEEDYQSGNLENGYGDIITVTLYPVERDIDDVNGTGVDQWIVDTSQWFDITDYLRSTICGECGEYKPDDDRVFGGLKCGECTYK
jgi:hypothetical protein|tara:strand:+ start:957 stop:1439 length:483 start_codon:yes stop_codon:yes gene_type:complete